MRGSVCGKKGSAIGLFKTGQCREVSGLQQSTQELDSRLMTQVKVQASLGVSLNDFCTVQKEVEEFKRDDTGQNSLRRPRAKTSG